MAIAKKKKGLFSKINMITLISLNKEFKRIWEAIEELKGLNQEVKIPVVKKTPAKPETKKTAKKTPVLPVKKGDVKWDPNQGK